MIFHSYVLTSSLYLLPQLSPLVSPTLTALALTLYSPLPDPRALPTAALASLALTAADLQLARAAAVFPPCMWRLVRELELRGHAKYHARLQLNLFFKGNLTNSCNGDTLPD